MIYLLSKLISVLGGRDNWATSKELAKYRSYYRR